MNAIGYRHKLIYFIKHPVAIITLLSFIGAGLAFFLCRFVVVPLLIVGGFTALMDTFGPHVLSGDEARKVIEGYVDVSLSEGGDFYYYHSFTPGEFHDLMRFSLPPAKLDEILGTDNGLCFGTELQPHPGSTPVIFITPMAPNYGSTTPNAVPTLDYSWMTPMPNRNYVSKYCSSEGKEQGILYKKILVDQSQSDWWTVWLQIYSG